MMPFMAACISMPVNCAELTRTPSLSVYASVISSNFNSRSFGWSVMIFGMLYFVANIQSRWSSDGTPMTAPVP